jgi:hypothetical protein
VELRTIPFVPEVEDSRVSVERRSSITFSVEMPDQPKAATEKLWVLVPDEHDTRIGPRVSVNVIISAQDGGEVTPLVRREVPATAASVWDGVCGGHSARGASRTRTGPLPPE